jgi:type IV pilus assembly protein PilE
MMILRRPCVVQRPPILGSRGFTIIELVIAMLIVSVLLSIAMPGYHSYVRQGRRTDAKSALLDMASLEERYFSVNNVYTQQTTDLGYTGTWPVTVGSGYYQVSITQFTPATPPSSTSPGGTPASYTLQALPINDQLKDTACTSFSLTSGGVQSSTPAGSSCW